MKKVLIISFFYHRRENIASLRPQGLSKYLPQYGWQPVVLTSHESTTADKSDNVVEIPYSSPLLELMRNSNLVTKHGSARSRNNAGLSWCQLLRKLPLRVWEEVVAYPDGKIGWYNHAVRAGKNLLSESDYDAILSTSYPVTSHLVAQTLSIESAIPWVADFQDLWTQNHFYTHTKARRLVEERLERKVISTARALTTVSEPLAGKLSRLHSKEVICIPNGFDPDEMNLGSSTQSQFTITYTGTIYRGKQDPLPLFQALAESVEAGRIARKNIAIHFYGPGLEWLAGQARSCGIGDIVRLNGCVPRNQILVKQRESHVLLLLAWNDPSEKGVYTGKLFDYLAARRPILSIGRKGTVIDRLLSETESGIQTTSKTETRVAIERLFDEYNLTGRVAYQGRSDEVMKYSQTAMAERFSHVLDAVCTR